MWQLTERVKLVCDAFKAMAAEAATRKSWYMISCPHDPPTSNEVVSNCVLVGPLAPPVQQVFNDKINVSKPDHVIPQEVPTRNDSTMMLGFRIIHNNDTAPPSKLTINSLQRKAGWNLELKNSQTLSAKIEHAKTKDIAVDPFICEFDADKIIKCEVLPHPHPAPKDVFIQSEDII